MESAILMTHTQSYLLSLSDLTTWVHMIIAMAGVFPRARRQMSPYFERDLQISRLINFPVGEATLTPLHWHGVMVGISIGLGCPLLIIKLYRKDILSHTRTKK